MLGQPNSRGSDSGYCELQPASERHFQICDTDLIPPLHPAGVAKEDEDGSSGSTKNNRMTGSSCQALRHAVSALNRLDDFTCEKIGSGFFSEVFKVTHRTTGQVMVLKMNLLRSNRPNMLKEVQLMNKLSHPNILGFMGVCVHEGQLHALTEYINGGSLEQLIQNSSVELPHLTRMKLALDIAKGMEYLHSRGVFHRDLTSKNVLIKKNEESGEMMAVVGDFGLAAKIPDPMCPYRLPTVGSPYWMSPECLKGQWYNEKSDVFSYGIILCELIARVEADPDILPRTENFGLDYLAFSEMCGPCPPEFLKLAFSCCTFEPKSRPSFAEIVIRLTRIIADYELQQKQQQQEQQEIQMLGCASLPVDRVCAPAPAVAGARSEEVISCAGTGAAQEERDAAQFKKVCHRRSWSEDVGNLVFPMHTAPSEKARCHFVVTPKHVGESMVRQDPHYKPSRANPFAALSQFRGVKKILGGLNKGSSSSSFTSGPGGDLFSSCFELPSPFYGPTPPSTPTAETDSIHEAAISGIMGDTVVQSSPDDSDSTAGVLKVHKPNQPLSLPSSPTMMRRRIFLNMKNLSTPRLASSTFSSDEESNVPKKNPVTSNCQKTCADINSKCVTVDDCDMDSSNLMLSHPLFIASESLKSESLSETCTLHDSQHTPLFINHRVCSSSLNLADAGVLLTEDPGGGLGLPTALRRRGSCESGFFSSVSEDFTITAGDLLLPSEFGSIHTVPRSHHNTSSATLSSSSAASSLFLLDDSANSTTTVSSLRSGSGELCDFDELGTPGGIVARSTPHHHSLIYSAKRSSSIYTDSSEDISSLGGSDISYWEDRNCSARPRHISRIVEYFERKQSGAATNTVSRLSSTAEQGTSVWELPDGSFSVKHQRELLFHQGTCGSRNSPVDFARRMESSNLNDAIRSSKIALLRKSLEKAAIAQQQASHQQGRSVSGAHNDRTLCTKRTVNATQRLMICEGAVRSKLPLFDKK